MALFQKSVLNQYLKQLDKSKVEIAYQKFKAHFHNTTIQQQIRESKEEQYQEGFFRDLFVDVFGYTLNPQPNFNLTTELKNETNSKKADGAILQNGNAIAVIELKGTNTTDLATVAPQAFGYKNNQKDCKYVIISNFEKLRFYIDNAIDFEEFNLFTLTESEFSLLYLCLHIDNIFSDLPAKIKQASTVKEQDVTKQLYKDYSEFKRKLFADIVHLNPQYDKLILFKKSQKLLDRILFILFAEDRGLLQANTIQTILDEFENLKKLDAYQPLYERFKKHFTYLNIGFKNEKYEVFGYNGGLFANDEILDNILISDNLLFNYTPTLAKYDYETDVDVNILGHIFEHSLNDIEEIQAELDGTAIDKTKTKRKKDGVFYTPKYITKYIVENTIGALCSEKRNEFEIIADNYTPDKRKAKKKELLQKLDNYQSWLLQITIVDPACGSGAFLNQALDFLIQEHKNIDELRAQLLGESMVLPDHEVAILENNIFGVDLNEESVEIARLSLWLRTARKGRKLNSLNNNIKCGNSLIDDETIAGEKAFNWQKEFPKIFKTKDKQAFHVVLTTHNSRTSQRMIDYGVIKGDPIELNIDEEIALTQIIGKIIKDNHIKCLTYNICKDHVHLILVCETEELTALVQKIKSISSKEFHRLNIPMGHDPLEHKNHLWSQKFFRANLDVWELNTVTNKPGYVYKDSYLQNAIEYIKNNRTKHTLPHSEKLNELIKEFCVEEDDAFKLEYTGGFDVVIGNPPYLVIKGGRWLGGFEYTNEAILFIRERYTTAEQQINTYNLFFELCSSIAKNDAYISLITPNTFLTNEYSKKLRQLFLEKSTVLDLNNVGIVFEDAGVETIVVTYKNFYTNNNITKITTQSQSSNINILDFKNFTTDYKFLLELNETDISIIKKLNKTDKLNKYAKVWRGLTTGNDAKYLTNKKTDIFHKKLITGKDTHRYFLDNTELFVLYKKDELDRARDERIFLLSEKLVSKFVGTKLTFAYDNEQKYVLNSCCVTEVLDAELNIKYILTLLNAKLTDYYFKKIFADNRDTFPIMKSGNIEDLPFKKISLSEQQPFIEKAEIMLQKNKELQTIKTNFIKVLQSQYTTHSMGHDPLGNKKLSNWNVLSFKDFSKELEKQKIKLTLSEKAELLQYFEAEQTKANTIQQTITQTDKEIDQMVYKLYVLTDEEIAIVEDN